MADREIVTVNRDVEAILVPSGGKVEIKQGAEVAILQSLGGSYTVSTQGYLLRIDGHDADAIGKEPLQSPQLPENAGPEDVERLVWEQLHTCYDPEIPIDMVELGLIYRCEVKPLAEHYYRVEIDMTLTAPGCGMGDVMAADVRRKVLAVPQVEEVEVNVVFEPPWDASRMSDAARLQTGMF